jgi:iron complex transport system ATP-binding protein
LFKLFLRGCLAYFLTNPAKVRMQKIIEIKNATVYRQQTRVFNELSLEISQGCNTAILGPNGSGKTTLLKLLLREIYPLHRDGSYVRVFGRERWNVWEMRAHFGIVSHDLQQQYASNARGINVILSGYYSSIDTAAHQQFSTKDKDRAYRIMNTLGVAELKDRTFSAMSTGEQRRFLLGRALVNEPEALVLDEPTSGLDLKACFQYLDTVRGLMRDGKTVILVTHHIHEIPPEVSRVVLLKDGEVGADGEKAEILTKENLSNLFDTPIELVQVNGFYQAVPGTV